MEELRTVSPLLSIITINFNNKDGLHNTLASVSRQSFRNLEHIVIDGGSTDGSKEVIESFKSSITYWVSEKDRGIYNAMNKGIVQAKGKYIQFLNSGDIFTHTTVLEKVFSTERVADIVYGDIDYIFPNGRKRYQSLHGDRLTMAHFFADTIAHPAAFIKRQLFDDGMFDDQLSIVADNKFFYDRVIMKNCTVEYLPIVMVDFETIGLSSRPENWKKTNEERDRVIREMLPPRIYKDYELLLQVIHSPLLKYMVVLNRTDRFQSFVAFVVGFLVKIYTWIRPIDTK